MNLLNLPKPLEDVKEPKRKEGQSEEAFNKEMEFYRLDKEEHDFWAQFEIRSLMVADDEENDVLIAVDYKDDSPRKTSLIAGTSLEPVQLQRRDETSPSVNAA